MIDTAFFLVETMSKLAVGLEGIVLILFAHDFGAWCGRRFP